MKYLAIILLLTLANLVSASQAITCIYIAKVAKQVMELRQAGVGAKYIRYSFPDYPRKFEIYKSDILLLRIINDAFQEPVHEAPTEKLQAVYKFDNKWFEDCLSKKFKIKGV